MTMWIPFRANVTERKNGINNKSFKQTPYYRLKYCKICQKQMQGAGVYCRSCLEGLRQQQKNERKGKL